MAPKGDYIITVHEVNQMTKSRKKRRDAAGRSGDPQVLSTAWHEAGHAIAYFITGQRFKYVTIVPTDWALGHCMGVLPPPSIRNMDDFLISVMLRDECDPFYRARGFLERQVIIDLAGDEAQALYTGAHPVTQLPTDDDDIVMWATWHTQWQTFKQSEPAMYPNDLHHACAMTALATDSEDEAVAYLRQLQLRARRLVTRHRDEIEALAVCLTIHRKLTYKRAHQLVYEMGAQWEQLRALRAMLDQDAVIPDEQAG